MRENPADSRARPAHPRRVQRFRVQLQEDPPRSPRPSRLIITLTDRSRALVEELEKRSDKVLRWRVRCPLRLNRNIPLLTFTRLRHKYAAGTNFGLTFNLFKSAFTAALFSVLFTRSPVLSPPPPCDRLLQHSQAASAPPHDWPIPVPFSIVRYFRKYVRPRQFTFRARQLFAAR